MDISAVLPVSMGQGESSCSSSSLNEEFSATTPNGDKVFTKPVGDKTVFTTPSGGQVTVAFLFDPEEQFSSNDAMASISTDYMTELREGFTKYALAEADIAPKNKSLEETLWDQITSLLPKETLAKNVFSDKSKLDSYLNLIENVTKANFNEEQKLTDFMKSQAFSFSFRIAVDSYPEENQQKKQKKKDKCGVLTFHLEGSLKAKEESMVDDKDETGDEDAPASRKRKLNGGGSLDTDTKAEAKEEEVKTEESANANANSSKKRKEKEVPARQKVLQDMQLDEAFQGANVLRYKEFPISATLFFENIGRWFSACISSKHSKLEKLRNKNPLYQ